MNADEYRAAIKSLGLSQVGASRLLGIDARTSRRWALGEKTVAPTAARFLRYLIATGATVEDVARIVARGEDGGEENTQ